MRYTVIWRHSAQDRLALLWMQAADREAVRQAADQFEYLLKTSPQVRGNDQQGVYEYTIPPLQIVFEVSPGDRKVTVLRVVYLGQ